MWYRIAKGSKPCKWCQDREGQSENVKDIDFARHDHCQCAIINDKIGEFHGTTKDGEYLYSNEKGYFNSSVDSEFQMLTKQEGDTLLKEYHERVHLNRLEKDLKRHYDSAIEKGELSPLVNYKEYSFVNNRIRSELHGITTDNGLVINSHSKHFVNRIFGSVEQKRSGVKIEDIYETLINPIEIKKRKDSVVLVGKNNKVSINPKTGNLVQTNPIRRKKK